VLHLTPQQLYEKIVNMCQIKFNFALNADQKQLKCLRSTFLKSALLRDLCKAIGVQILQKDSKSGFVLGNDLKEIQAHHNELRIAAAKL
jgi:hypothetical protein